MNGKLSIKPLEEDNILLTYIMACSSNYDYEIDISSSLDRSFEEIISDSYDFEQNIDYCISLCEDNERLEVLEKIKNDRLNYLRNVSDIEFFYEPKIVAKFVRDNPILLTKRIIFSDYDLLNSNLIEEIESSFGENTSNIYFKIEGNYSLITFDEYKKTTDSINKKIAEIERFDFSPLEKIMYVYDMVRDKVYLEVDEDEDKLNSRNLSSALLGDKIVCVGYSVIFQTLLNKLGIDCHKIRLDSLEHDGGHARVAIHVKDEKYDVDGIYFFDPTWDSKRNKDDNKFLSSYKYFALTKTKMDEEDKGKLIDKSFPYFSSDIAWEFDDLVDEVGFKELPNYLVNSINSMSYLVTGNNLISKLWFHPLTMDMFNPNKDEISEKIYELTNYFDVLISADVLLEVLYNVRKQQYYSNPEKYPFNLDDFYKTVLISDWEFDTSEIKKIMMSFKNNEYNRKIKFLEAIKFVEESELDKRIEQVKLTKTLRNIYNSKTK